MHPISTALREARQAQNRTLADIAAEAGVTRAYVSSLELGNDNPLPKGVEAVLKALGLRVVVLPLGSPDTESSVGDTLGTDTEET